jgi:diguanylate cyclase (GGDEF)-like protein/PAS domain S-box-containing protein
MVTVRLLQRLLACHRPARLPWTFMTAVSTGSTIWCTHFVAMIAYKPGVPIAYEPLLTGVSLGVAILGGGVALIVAAERAPWRREIGGGIFGLAVSAMHYTGMAALAVGGHSEWSVIYVAGSVVAAAALGAAAFRRAALATSRAGNLTAVALVVLAIVSLHFTGMAALTITPFAPMAGQSTSDLANAFMALAVAGVGMLVLGTGAASYALDLQSRRNALQRLEEIVEGSVDGMVVEQGGRIIAANAAFAQLVGLDQASLVGKSLGAWVADARGLPTGELSQTSLEQAEGATIPVEVAVRHDVGDQGGAPMMIYAVRDLRARMAQERRIAHLARNDSLTGLPNRASFLEYLSRRTGPDTGQGRIALLAMDLDRFKEVNDIHGHAAGDELLVQISQRMRAVLQADEFVARLGGDEFVAMVPVTEREDALGLADRLRAAIVAPVDLGHAEVSCGVSTGIAVWPDDGATVSDLINDADLAMYRAKSSLTSDVCFYEEEMDEAVRNRRRTVQALREALDQDQFELNYQIQAALHTGEVTGYEALLRWRLPDGTYVSPADFIPLAEENGLILPIGEWVLRHACRAAAAWERPHKIAINLSPVQLSHIDLPRLVHEVLLETGLPPARLELEITETAMITDLDRTTHVLRQLKLLGVSIAMDDFGTGYSSLSTLRAFPFDKIKLDQSFMSEVGDGPQAHAIIRAVLALGESLGIPVLAEGVETLEQLTFLADQGCDEVQGFLLGRPQASIQPDLLTNIKPARAEPAASPRRAATG